MAGFLLPSQQTIANPDGNQGAGVYFLIAHGNFDRRNLFPGRIGCGKSDLFCHSEVAAATEESLSGLHAGKERFLAPTGSGLGMTKL
jgi:hypothetical protein